jgi:hypothetical protein
MSAKSAFQMDGEPIDRRPSVIDEAQIVVGDPVPEEDLAAEMDRPAWNGRPFLSREIGVREVHDEARVVAAQGGAEKERTVPSQGDAEAGEEPRPVVVEAELAEALRGKLSEAIEDREEIVVLEHARAVVDPRRAGQDVVAILDLDQVIDAGSLRLARSSIWRT